MHFYQLMLIFFLSVVEHINGFFRGRELSVKCYLTHVFSGVALLEVVKAQASCHATTLE